MYGYGRWADAATDTRCEHTSLISLIKHTSKKTHKLSLSHGMDHAVQEKCVFAYKMQVSMSCTLQLSQYPIALG